MQIREKIEKWAEETLQRKAGFALAHPKELQNGDYTLIINGPTAAEDFERLNENKLPEIERVEFAAPRFINLFLSPRFFADAVEAINQAGEKYGKNDLFKGQKIIIEYTDPNPFKEFHIGHLMSNSIGEAISRIIEAGSSDMKRLSYGGDVGLHVAKAIFGVLADKQGTEKAKNSNEKKQIEFWAQAYVFGNNQYEDDPQAKEKIDSLNKIIFDKSDPEINALYDWGREVSIKHFLEMFQKLDTRFDRNIWESEVTEDALKAVELGLQKGILQKSEGAVIFRGENYGLHTRVFVNSKGVPVYEAKELGLGIKKYEDFPFDKSIVVTGNEQNEYFKVVLKAMELIKPEVAGKTVHVGHGMLRFASGKMSSRKGNVITAESLIEQIKEKVFAKLEGRDYAEAEKQSISESVAIGAVRYSILRQAIGADIIFDFEKSISFEGDSGPYLQYTAVRAGSVLERAQNAGLKSHEKRPQDLEVSQLERYLYRFPEVVERAAKEYAPHHIATYLTELSGMFNNFYAKERIVDENDPGSPYKIALTEAAFYVLKSGLHLLGIKVPERM